MYGKMTMVLLVELLNLGDVDMHFVEIVGKRQHYTRENFLESLCTRKVSAQTREVKLV
jgi:hypothetical protein